MASLKENIQIIHDSISKNVGIVTAQARAHARAAAAEYMENRNNEDIRILKNKDYENTEAVIVWLAKLEEVNKEMPELRDEHEPALEFSDHSGNGN